MYYGSTEEFTDWDEREFNNWKIQLVYFLLFFIPKANPDNEKLYSLVKKWLLEIEEGGIPIREIALNKDGRVLFSSPNSRNYGLWTDSGDVVSKERLISIEENVFENFWDESIKMSN